jgi:opacity protein-like surface antigen
MKFLQLLRLGVLTAPAAVTGLAHAHAQARPDAESEASARIQTYVSVSMGSVSGADYSYAVEELFPVVADVGGGYVFDAAYGMLFGDAWRGEVAVSWQDRDNANSAWQFGQNLTGPGMSAYTLDAIGYYDFRINSRANAYFGAGLGLASVNLDDGVVTDSTGAGLHLQAIAGVEAKLSSNVKVFAEGRVRSMRPSVEAGQAGASGRTDGFDITSTSISAGLKFLL